MKNFGVAAGAYTGGVIIYVGYGNNWEGWGKLLNLNQFLRIFIKISQKLVQNPCPGMLTDLPANPGGFYGCGNVRYKADGNYYLLNHPNLRWVQTTSSGMKTLPNALFIMSGLEKFYFGRYVASNNITYLGKAHHGLSEFKCV